MMERRHQVFVSSTYTDLLDERQQIIHALLELDCFPAGMELFPATNDDAWELIRSVIDDSDYYLLVIGGRYGSMDDNGMGFTEKEYDYAVATKKPIIAFLHGDPGQIPQGKTELTDAGRLRLDEFRKKVEEAKHCKYWKSADELGGVVSRSIVQLRKKYPSDGWVPGKYATEDSVLLELERLRNQVRELEAQVAATGQAETDNGLDPGEFARGDEVYIFTPTFSLQNPTEQKDVELEVSWDTLLAYTGPSLIGECDEETLEQRIQLAFWHVLPRALRDRGASFDRLVLPYVVFDQIKVQLRALGYMIPGAKRRAVSDRKVYWALSQAGELRLLRLQAIKTTKEPVQVQLAGM